MAKQHSRRRRKKYQPGSAFAGDVTPTGVLGMLSSPRTMKIVFLVMAVGLAAGSLGALTRFTIFSGNNSSSTANNFVQPKDTPNAGTGTPTPQFKQYTSAPPLTIDPSKRYTATIKTSLGDIQVELLAAQAPQTVNNFVFLAGDGFYNGLIFHAAVSDPKYVEAGDPGCRVDASGDLCRGSGDPGYQLAPETAATAVAYQEGTLGMANASQFFIALSGSSKFDQYTPFARVISGLDVAQRITKGTAIESVTIQEQ